MKGLSCAILIVLFNQVVSKGQKIGSMADVTGQEKTDPKIADRKQLDFSNQFEDTATLANKLNENKKNQGQNKKTEQQDDSIAANLEAYLK